MVASTDLSHFHSEKRARRLDAEVQRAVAGFDPARLMETLETGSGEACGGGPMASIMTAARRLGAASVQIVDYTTSAETTGDFDNVVGYLSAAIVAGDKAVVNRAIGEPAAKRKHDDLLDDAAKAALHRIAHEAIAARFSGTDYMPSATAGIDEKRGIFVTLSLNGDLRGCIGQIRARSPLYRAAAEMAIAAAFEDPRFPPLSEAEFGSAEIEMSVLTPLVRVHELREIEVGRDGLMIRLDLHSGLLLPQVASEHGWDRETFLEQTCLKAGLPKNSYRDKHAEIYRFSAQVF